MTTESKKDKSKYSFLFEEEHDRPTLFPIRYQDIWNYRKELEGLRWIAQEVNMTEDSKHYNTRLTPGDRHYIKHILGFFGFGDEIVLQNLDENVMPLIKIKEFQYVYREISTEECIHSESYSIQIDTILSGKEKEEVFNAIKTMPVMIETKKWITPWLSHDAPFENRLLCIIAWEGVLFSDKFSGIQSYASRNLMPGLVEFNKLISRDENKHVEIAMHMIIHDYVERPSEETAHKIFKKAVELSQKFVDAAVLADDPPLGLSRDLLKKYICFNADVLLEKMSYKTIWDIKENPLEFMTIHAMNKVSKTDFFVKNPTQYQTLTSKDALAWNVKTGPIPILGKKKET